MVFVSDSVDRVIHIPLTEAEWQAFLAARRGWSAAKR